MKEEYIEKIDRLMVNCQDVALLDLICQLLVKSKSVNGHG